MLIHPARRPHRAARANAEVMGRQATTSAKDYG
jgi:hypothetical protein